MSLMTREDMLRELELLPVWQLNKSLSSMAEMPVLTALNVILDEPLPNLSSTIEPAPSSGLDIQASTDVALSSTFRLLISDDANLGFVLDNTLADTPDVAILLANIFKAINVSCRIDLPDATLATLNQHPIKLIIVMGEVAANSLMGKSQTVEDWRGTQLVNPVYYQHLPMVITYHPAFLLKNMAYKAQAWADLCLAKVLLQAL